MNETLVKYLAGLLDADGSLSYQFARTPDGKYRVYLRLVLVAAESVDKDGKFVKSLPTETGMGTVVSTIPNNNNWYKRNDWVVASWNDLNKLLPRIIKHQVIKAQHWQRMFDIASSLRGKTITLEEREILQEQCKHSRANTGAIKPKKHPTWAWVAGYLDGDGSYINRYCKNKKYTSMRVNATAHKNDKVALELLKKAFGGNVSQVKDTNILRWWRNLGYRDSSFTIKFLGKIVNHSKLKKHAIEQIIHNHKQRLSELTSTEDATV